MRGARRVVEKKGLVRRDFLLAVDVEDRLVGDLIAQVAAVGTNMRLILHQVRMILVRHRAEKAKEMIEAFSRRPMIEGASIGCLFVRRHAVLTYREGVVAVIAKNLGNGSRCGWSPAIPARESSRHDGV